MDERIELLKEHIEQSDDIEEASKIQDRITRLSSSVSIIKIGGATEIEVTEKKHRVEDALEAVKSAQEEGMVPGGGTALLRAAQDLAVEYDNKDQEMGGDIILEAIKAPIQQMAINCDLSPDLILNTVLNAEDNMGYNFATGELTDLFEEGVIDPTKVTRNALQNAASVASTLVTTNYAIVEE